MNQRPLAAFLAFVAVATATATAQQSSYPVRDVAVVVDSGVIGNPTATEQVVWTHDLVEDGDWLQLHFVATSLGSGSRLRIHAPSRPDAVQWHDARSLADYRGYSCQFVGPTLRVELLAAPGSSSRVRIDRVIAHEVDDAIEYDTICGTTDDRVLSNDPRICRINAGCTGWLFSEFAVGTAGHCMSTTAGQILHFNVPLSSATGGAIPAHPNDQYAMEAFHMFLNGGVGADWSASAAVRNSNTQLYPGEAQGSWFAVVAAPAFAAGQSIRISGHGSGNGASGSPTWNLVQKTHVGARQSTATATALRYGTDTTGGNSGSPVVFEATGEVIGVHTHGGCTSTGGGNSGTDAVRADWVAARAVALALHTLGAVTPFGAGCGGSAGVPLLAITGIPELGRSITAAATQLQSATSVPGLFVVGSSSSTWNGNTLPIDLAPAGMNGCQLHVAFDFSDVVLGSAGSASRAYAVPVDPQLVGVHAYLQFFGLDATAANPAGVVATNAADVRIGN